MRLHVWTYGHFSCDSMFKLRNAHRSRYHVIVVWCPGLVWRSDSWEMMYGAYTDVWESFPPTYCKLLYCTFTFLSLPIAAGHRSLCNVLSETFQSNTVNKSRPLSPKWHQNLKEEESEKLRFCLCTQVFIRKLWSNLCRNSPVFIFCFLQSCVRGRCGCSGLNLF